MGICCSSKKKDYEQQILEMKTLSAEDKDRIRQHEEKEIELTGAIKTNLARVSELSQALALAKGEGLAATMRVDELEATCRKERERAAQERAEWAAVRAAHSAVCKSLRDGAKHAEAAARAEIGRLEAAMEAARREAAEASAATVASASKEQLLRTTNEKLMDKIREQRAAIQRLRAQGAHAQRKCDAFLTLHRRPSTISAIVGRICDDDMPRSEKLLYCHFAQVLLKHLSDFRHAPRKAPPPRQRQTAHHRDGSESSDTEAEPTAVEQGVNWIASWFDDDNSREG